MSRTDLKKGRTNQKLRTRKALLDAADHLVNSGFKPTLADVAEEAMVSRATAYRYFPSLDALLLEVALDRKVSTPEQILQGADKEDVAERVALVHDFLHNLVTENEQQFRLFLKASMDQSLQIDEDSDTPLRGARRIPMLSLALEPSKEKLDQETFDKLLYALSAMVSVEPFIALTDVCQIEPERGKEIMLWAVKLLVNATLR
ncbi:MAG: TetR/AcrR family transcriptional regulator [Desulfobacterales bacterium]|nr:TetR/AcrR family transcriptional regulator [Deltaproteobacteria bacterium]NNK93277.1 TetR/AcrR family transcriptional regulator [Desulfobacterales bacterium]